MKKIKLKKLTLNKEMVAELPQENMNNIKGGRKTFIPTQCEIETGLNCPTLRVSCVYHAC